MLTVLAILGLAFAAFSVWLMVRIINRREQCAKRTAIALLLGVRVVYPLSWGPVLCLNKQLGKPRWMEPILGVNMPVALVYLFSPKSLQKTIEVYLDWWAA